MSARFSVNNGSGVWYNNLKMNASVHFGYGGRLPPIAAAQSMQPENEFPVR